ncbi:DUF1127 domain-containing protein [Oryzicola mucosus]|uniref:DUF1127 domain-containing protein n=1 Tax=Oryzicola mucosus TaxID=2767425 RepID=UPI0038B32E61
MSKISRDYSRTIAAFIGKGFIWLAWRLERRRTRLALLNMTDEQLWDVGISRADAYREGIRSFLD